MATVLGLLVGVAIAVLVLVTLPWWITILGPPVERWLDWTIRRIEQREERHRR